MTTKLVSKEVAKIVRNELTENFPGVKFSVKSDYDSINIYWTDGPTQKDVDEIVKFFRGQEKYSFRIGNSSMMQDSYRWVEKVYKGETIEFGNKYIFTNRTLSTEFYQICLDQYAVITNEKARFENAKISVKPETAHCSPSLSGMDIELIDDIYRFARAYSNFS